MRCHHGTREEETCPDCTEEIVQLRAALPDPDKLELIALHFDMRDRIEGNTQTEVQDDLREWAQAARKILANIHMYEHENRNDPACKICQDRAAEDKL